MEPHPSKIFGYTDRLYGRPGEALTFHVSSEGPPTYDASLVRLSHGFTGSAGPGFVEYEVPEAGFAGSYTGEHHVCQPGSFVEIDDPGSVLADPTDMAISVYVYATLPLTERNESIGAYHVTQNSIGLTNQRQTICGTWDEATATGYALVLDEGIPTVLWGDDGQPRSLSTSSASTRQPLVPHRSALPGQRRRRPLDANSHRELHESGLQPGSANRRR